MTTSSAYSLHPAICLQDVGNICSHLPVLCRGRQSNEKPLTSFTHHLTSQRQWRKRDSQEYRVTHADWASVEPLTYLEPFLEVIRSPETSGPITGVALTSVRRLLEDYTFGNAPRDQLCAHAALHARI